MLLVKAEGGDCNWSIFATMARHFQVQLCHPLVGEQIEHLRRWSETALFYDFVVDESDPLQPVLRMSTPKPVTTRQLQNTMTLNFKR